MILEMRVRRATASDITAVSALGDEIQAAHAARWPEVFRRGPGFAAYWQKLLEASDHAMFVAERGGRVIGMAVVQLMEETTPILQPLRICRIHTIVVASAERGKGAGRALLESIDGYAREMSVADLRLTVYEFNRDAIALYERMGYSIRAHVMGKFVAPPE